MKKEIMYTESAPEKKYLWLHYKNGNLVLEAFGNKGWESVGDDSKSEAVNDVLKEVENIKKDSNKKAIKVDLPKLTEKSSKQALLSTIETLTKVLVKAGIIEVE